MKIENQTKHENRKFQTRKIKLKCGIVELYNKKLPTIAFRLGFKKGKKIVWKEVIPFHTLPYDIILFFVVLHNLMLRLDNYMHEDRKVCRKIEITLISKKGYLKLKSLHSLQ